MKAKGGRKREAKGTEDKFDFLGPVPLWGDPLCMHTHPPALFRCALSGSGCGWEGCGCDKAQPRCVERCQRIEMHAAALEAGIGPPMGRTWNCSDFLREKENAMAT